ncbi:coenzyme F420 hydrogenase subunit beta [Nesterenkonia aurantiaca]|uniref:Coenzyme F420 hydrogenase subunit beta n=2 Tax=Nesterenkonia aurantiaca TaxID=1436010 RepID=A0A4R7FVD3_9MICC|nr:coenzyme F420 hydrogenase subunit beta [Nesterenkonia aurantiaca]
MVRTALEREVSSVVKTGRCTGCAGCTHVSPRVTMRETSDGFLRPKVERAAAPSDKAEAARFRNMCPGLRVSAPAVEPGGQLHGLFGRYHSVWRAWSTDPVIRTAGSSGGVLTALVSWLIDSGHVSQASGVSASESSPKRSVPVRIMSRDEALASAGSRYAPVGALEGASLDSKSALVVKPCEAVAARSLTGRADEDGESSGPVLLSFFCAGTPSQNATESLVEEIGLDPDRLKSLRYRGDGWPGHFKAEDTDGHRSQLTYVESWGSHLGRDLQTRCKLCVDGTGESADIAVGDFWDTDDRGYPLFEEQEGISVAIARTRRGQELLMEAAEAGVVILESLEMDRLVPVQPLQVKRRQTLPGRLLGRSMAGFPTTKYPGYGILSNLFRGNLKLYKSALGTFRRSIGSRLRGGSPDR